VSKRTCANASSGLPFWKTGSGSWYRPCTMKPAAASMDTRPCLSSAARYHARVSSEALLARFAGSQSPPVSTEPPTSSMDMVLRVKKSRNSAQMGKVYSVNYACCDDTGLFMCMQRLEQVLCAALMLSLLLCRCYCCCWCCCCALRPVLLCDCTLRLTNYLCGLALARCPLQSANSTACATALYQAYMAQAPCALRTQLDALRHP
jgi:hypothetical protein